MVKIKEECEKSPSQFFSNLLNAYSKAFNKRYKRTGSLFQRPFKRKRITEEDYLKQLVFYIHLNPVHHGIVDDFKIYPYSFYKSILSNKPTNLKRTEVIERFHGKESFDIKLIDYCHNYILRKCIMFCNLITSNLR